eukprot:1995951-Prymnesium_polylepis.2
MAPQTLWDASSTDESVSCTGTSKDVTVSAVTVIRSFCLYPSGRSRKPEVTAVSITIGASSSRLVYGP